MLDDLITAIRPMVTIYEAILAEAPTGATGYRLFTNHAGQKQVMPFAQMRAIVGMVSRYDRDNRQQRHAAAIAYQEQGARNRDSPKLSKSCYLLARKAMGITDGDQYYA